jgi:hypothetical protein
MTYTNTTALYAIYHDTQRQPIPVSITVDLFQRWANFSKYTWVYAISDRPSKISRFDYFDSKSSALAWLQRAQRLVAFANASKLQLVSKTAAHEAIPLPDWVDKLSYWADREGSPMILLEGYKWSLPGVTNAKEGQFTWSLIPSLVAPYHDPLYPDGFSMLLTTHSNKYRLAEVIAKLGKAAKSGATS